MGEYTKYKLQVDNYPDILEGKRYTNDIIKTLRTGNRNASSAFNDQGKYYDELKWYDHEEDIKEFSKLYPNFLFTLKGENNIQGLWVKYFLDGKMQLGFGYIEYDEFNKDDLE